MDLSAAGRSVRTAALTSLGFGHVGALLVYAHPGIFEQALCQQHGSSAAAACRTLTPR